MGKEHNTDLLRFLSPFPPEVRQTALWLRDFVWDMYPQANELIYDNYNAVAFGWSITERQGHVFCSIAVGRSSHNVHFGFYWGSEIPDPEKMLLGEGSQYRYILVKDTKDFPKAYMKKLVKEAYANSMSKVKKSEEIIHGITVVKSVSEAKRAAAKQKKK